MLEKDRPRYIQKINSVFIHIAGDTRISVDKAARNQRADAVRPAFPVQKEIIQQERQQYQVAHAADDVAALAKEMMGRLIDHPFPSHVDGDAAAFSTEPWRQFSFTDATDDNGITWITTPSRGSALCDRGSQRDGLIISSPANQPLWVYLSMVAMAINFGETSEV